MPNDVVIKVENLSKQYRIGARQQGYKTFREAIVEGVKSPINVIRSRFQKSDTKQLSEENTIWALKDVSFEVKRGEVVGVIGRNGAGKSTLLKVLSKITEPTTGRVELRGRVGSLLEVGTGFHPELTGHENIYLYGAILGMDRWEVTRKFDEIVAFAELDRFIETPVKRYSSGMYMRLAFSVAAHLEPEILLVDEVLAVGDMAFQKKCIGKMEAVSNEGRTVIFVSHNMGAIRSLCTDAMLIDSGTLTSTGDVHKVVSEYENFNISEKESVWVNRNEEEKKDIAYIEKIEILSSDLINKNKFLSNENILVMFKVHIREINPALKLGFDLIKNGNIVFRTQQVDSPQSIGTVSEGIHDLFCEIPAGLLNVGEYYITPQFSIHCDRYLIKESMPVLKFQVNLDVSKSQFHVVLNERNHPGAVFPLLKWEIR